MSVDLTIAVTARQERHVAASLLAGEVGAAVVMDPRQDLPPSKDGVWRAMRLAIQLGIDCGTSHVLVMQDDAEPCPGFRELAQRAITAKPHPLVTFYANRKECDEAFARGESWAKLTSFLNAQAFAIPCNVAPSLLHHGDDVFQQGGDERVRDWCKTWRYPVWATVPSLVEHGMPGESLIPGHSNSARTARIPWRGFDLQTINFEE